MVLPFFGWISTFSVARRLLPYSSRVLLPKCFDCDECRNGRNWPKADISRRTRNPPVPALVSKSGEHFVLSTYNARNHPKRFKIPCLVQAGSAFGFLEEQESVKGRASIYVRAAPLGVRQLIRPMTKVLQCHRYRGDDLGG
jgi:hypothetical protein